ncbi:uncharacterized protein LOC124197745 [Daphnia pulex]|uniref:uncharacterized protein LOC124197745 n=1 Tax=Daphnia pulex TaxID=6669 RepID=UPI001EDE53B6|nr:uncharacterized protein LOC124197745 [Daphnia pulex]
MYIVALFLLCFVSATWQQNIYWSFHPGRVPFYSLFDQNLQNYGPVLPKSDDAGLYLDPENRYDYQHNSEVEQRTLGRPSETIRNEKLRANSEPRFFGVGSYLASIVMNSLSPSVTSFTTATSTITAATVFSCYTSTMFSYTTACRRKRGGVPNLLIGDSNNEYFNAPLPLPLPLDDKSMAAAQSEKLPKEGRDVDLAYLVTSSQNEEERAHATNPKQTESSVDSYFRRNRNVFGSFKATSTLTSYSVIYSTSLRTVTNLAYGNGLYCVPTGFTLC